MDGRTETGRRQRPRLCIASHGKNGRIYRVFCRTGPPGLYIVESILFWFWIFCSALLHVLSIGLLCTHTYPCMWARCEYILGLRGTKNDNKSVEIYSRPTVLSRPTLFTNAPRMVISQTRSSADATSCRFWDIQCRKTSWPWNRGQRSLKVIESCLKVIENYTTQSGTYDFLLTFHSNHRSISHRFRDERWYPSKITRKSPIFPPPVYLTPPLKGLPVEFCIGAGVSRK